MLPAYLRADIGVRINSTSDGARMSPGVVIIHWTLETAKFGGEPNRTDNHLGGPVSFD